MGGRDASFGWYDQRKLFDGDGNLNWVLKNVKSSDWWREEGEKFRCAAVYKLKFYSLSCALSETVAWGATIYLEVGFREAQRGSAWKREGNEENQCGNMLVSLLPLWSMNPFYWGFYEQKYGTCFRIVSPGARETEAFIYQVSHPHWLWLYV